MKELHVYALMVVTLFLMMLCPADLQATDCEACEMHERNYHLAAIRLTATHMQYGNDDSAFKEFSALEWKNSFVKAFVKTVYSNSTVPLLQLAMFVCKSGLLTSVITAINTLYQEMVKNNQSENMEMIPMFFKIRSAFNDSGFYSLSFVIQKTTIDLNSRLSKGKKKIVNLAIDSINQELFNYSNTLIDLNLVLNNMQYAQPFSDDIVIGFMANANSSSTRFVNLLNFVLQLKQSNAIKCYFLAVIWRELQVSGAGETMEALAVWIQASQFVQDQLLLLSMSVSLSTPETQQCQKIARSNAPAFKEIAFSKYDSYFNSGNLSEIDDLHTKYKFGYMLLSYYISSLNIQKFQKNDFSKLIDSVDRLPYMADKCFVAAAISMKLSILYYNGTVKTFHHFQTLQIVKKIMSDKSYPNLDELSKSKCEFAYQSAPSVFHKLLYGNSTNCSLLNRHFEDDPLFCADSNSTENGYRNIFLGLAPYEEADKFWNIIVRSGTSNGVHIVNNFHTNFSMRYIKDTVKGSDKEFDHKTDCFHFHAVEDDYLLLEAISRNGYVSAGSSSSKICGVGRRCVEMIPNAMNKRAHWKLVCF